MAEKDHDRAGFVCVHRQKNKEGFLPERMPAEAMPHFNGQGPDRSGLLAGGCGGSQFVEPTDTTGILAG